MVAVVGLLVLGLGDKEVAVMISVGTDGDKDVVVMILLGIEAAGLA
jgi:hypothetical protein